MRVRGAIPIVVLVAALLAGCGGGSSSAGAARQQAAGRGEPFIEDGGPGPTPAGGTMPDVRRARRRIAAAHRVEEGEMVAGQEGWVRSQVGMFWTTNGGRTWRPITPPVDDAAYLVGAYFASPRRGWALAEPGREGATRPSIYATTDGGRSWHRSRLRSYGQIMPASKVSFSLVAGELFAQIKVEGDTASDFGPLLLSRDGGRHWRALPDPPNAGRIAFQSPRRGWLAGRSPSADLWRTLDGGRTWTEVEPASPTGVPTPSPPREEVESEGEGAVVSYLPPLIDRSGHGVLPELRSPRSRPGSEAIVWTTADRGQTWQRSARIPVPDFGGTIEAAEVFVRRGRSHSFLVHDPNTGAITTVGPDGRAGPTRPSRGSPRWSTGLTFSDRRHGFAYSSFSPGTSLVFTEDGGRDWTKVRPPRGPTPHPPRLRADHRTPAGRPDRRWPALRRADEEPRRRSPRSRSPGRTRAAGR